MQLVHDLIHAPKPLKLGSEVVHHPLHHLVAASRTCQHQNRLEIHEVVDTLANDGRRSTASQIVLQREEGIERGLRVVSLVEDLPACLPRRVMKRSQAIRGHGVRVVVEDLDERAKHLGTLLHCARHVAHTEHLAAAHQDIEQLRDVHEEVLLAEQKLMKGVPHDGERP
eukprot:scaffold7375_cov268-Pinguiococcus_pyrenoidosus.AAC.11